MLQGIFPLWQDHDPMLVETAVARRVQPQSPSPAASRVEPAVRCSACALQPAAPAQGMVAPSPTREGPGENVSYTPPHPQPHDVVDGSPPSLIYLSCQIESQALHPPPGLHSEPVHSTFFGLQPDTTRHMNSGLHLAGGHAIDPSASPGMFWD
jgi:hypothetical protein